MSKNKEKQEGESVKYKQGILQVINCDCMDLMKEYPDNYFDLAIVDPPYGINVGRQRVGSSRATEKWSTPKDYNYKTFDDSEPPTIDYFRQLFKISKNQIIWGGNYFVKNLPISKGWVVWDKKVDPKEHLSMCELAYTSFDSRAKMFSFLWAGFKKQVQEKRIHPTQKPVALYEWLLENYAEKGQKILDTHLGSGSSAIAAYYYGVGEFVGCELDKDYYEGAIERIEKETKQKKIF